MVANAKTELLKKAAMALLLIAWGIGVFNITSMLVHAGNYNATGVSNGSVLYRGASKENYEIQSRGTINYSTDVIFYSSDIHSLAKEASDMIKNAEDLLAKLG